MIMKRLTLVLTIAAVIALKPSASAHDTWLIPGQFRAAPKATVRLDITSGMEFPKLDAPVNPERVASAKCRLAGETCDLPDKSAAVHSLQFEAELPKAGVATIWVSLSPRSLELKPDEVQHYLDEVDAPAALRKQYEETKPPRWRESYTKHTKTFVRVGEPRDDRSWAEPVGAALEIVPEKDPTAVQPGDEFPVLVLKNGQPFAEFSLNAVAAGETKGETRKTDSGGRVVFRLGNSGGWMLRGTDIRKSTLPDTDWESDFATLTLEVAKR